MTTGAADGRARPGRGKQPRKARRSGRRAGESGTREAILAAARQRFGDYGYDRATIRGIAADAGVDPALVHHFYGDKERLFAAAVRLPMVPGDIVAAALDPAAREPGHSLGEHLVQTVLRTWDVAEIRSVFLGLLRSAATSEQAAAMMREFATETILSRVAEAAGAGPGPGRRPGQPDGRFRAALAASQILGLALTRYVLELEPLVTADTGELAAAIGPAVERYLTGDLRAGQR